MTTTITHWVDFATFAVEYNLRLLGVNTRDERGAVATETAVIIGILVAVAVAVGVIFMARARSNAENIPDTVPTP